MGEDPMAKLLQICASQNDLFGLDENGHVYQYNFNTSTWMALGHRRSSEADTLPADPFPGPPGSSRRRPADLGSPE